MVQTVFKSLIFIPGCSYHKAGPEEDRIRQVLLYLKVSFLYRPPDNSDHKPGPKAVWF